jgi:hypothetical protein
MSKNYIAEIKDNNDPDKEGKVQIYIPELHYGFQSSQYPWARQDREFTSDIPEINDLVWIYFEDKEYFKKAFYKNKLNLKQYHDHNKTIGSLTGVYPDIKYVRLKNGVSIALNSNQTEATIKVGSAEIYIDPNGKIKITGADIELNGSSKQFVTYTELDTALQQVITLLKSHMHPTAAPGAPSVSAQLASLTLDISAAKTTTIKTGG